jgi:hypothetical protein
MRIYKAGQERLSARVDHFGAFRDGRRISSASSHNSVVANHHNGIADGSASAPVNQRRADNRELSAAFRRRNLVDLAHRRALRLF